MTPIGPPQRRGTPANVLPPASYNLTPKTRTVRADQVRPGHIVIESPEHPAVVVRVARPSGGYRVRLWCRYVWQATHEPEWHMPDTNPDAAVRISKER